MTDRFRDSLSEYLDGELEPDRRELVERHLETCEECSAALAEIELVVARARTVAERVPAQDLWPGIQTRIRTGARAHGGTVIGFRRRISLSVPQLAAAAVTLTSLSAAGAWLTLRAAPGDGGSGVGPAADAPGTIALAADETDGTAGNAAEYGRQIAELERALFDGGRLPPETESKLRRALVTIDRALEDARRALTEMPDDPYLEQHVSSTMQRKADFLRYAVRLARG